VDELQNSTAAGDSDLNNMDLWSGIFKDKDSITGFAAWVGTLDDASRRRWEDALVTAQVADAKVSAFKEEREGTRPGAFWEDVFDDKDAAESFAVWLASMAADARQTWGHSVSAIAASEGGKGWSPNWSAHWAAIGHSEGSAANSEESRATPSDGGSRRLTATYV